MSCLSLILSHVDGVNLMACIVLISQPACLLFYQVLVGVFYHLVSGLYIIYKCLNLFYYFISDIVIYLIYIDESVVN